MPSDPTKWSAMLAEYRFTRTDGRPLDSAQKREMDDSLFEFIGTWAQERGLMVQGQALFELLTTVPVPAANVITPEQAEMLYQVQGCSEAGEGSYHDPVTDGLILALAKAAGVYYEQQPGTSA